MAARVVDQAADGADDDVVSLLVAQVKSKEGDVSSERSTYMDRVPDALSS